MVQESKDQEGKKRPSFFRGYQYDPQHQFVVGPHLKLILSGESNMTRALKQGMIIEMTINRLTRYFSQYTAYVSFNPRPTILTH